jgi:hypothetical protein
MRTRRLLATVATALVGGALAAATASAAAPCAPAQGTFDHSYQARLSPLADRAQAAAQTALGAQFTMLWLDPARQGWTIGVAPGPLTVDQARDAIVALLHAAFSPDDAGYLAGTLLATPEPFSKAQLDAARQSITDDLIAAHLGVGMSSGYGLCTLSDGVRVEVMLFNDSTPEIQDRVRAIIAPYGDIVRLGISAGFPPSPAAGVGQAPAPTVRTPDPGTQEGAPGPGDRAAAQTFSLGHYVTLPSARRCVRGATVHIALRSATRGQVRSVGVATAASGRKRIVGAQRLKRPLAVALHGHRTALTVTVRLTDGRVGRRTITLTRCG